MSYLGGCSKERVEEIEWRFTLSTSGAEKTGEDSEGMSAGI
jgi:hypothetical protein